MYYQNGGLSTICDPCFPSPSPTPSVTVSPTVSPSGMCYVVHNLLYGKVYTDGYYTVVHGINASHAYNPAPIILGKNPTCTESPGICTCAYTGGSTFSCPYTRAATLRYQYGATTTMTFVNESPVCRYTFNMFINFNSVSPTPSPSPSFTPAGSPTVSKTPSVSLSSSVSPSRSSSASASVTITSTSSVTPTISESEIPVVQPFIKKTNPTPSPEITPVEPTNSNGLIGIALGSVTVLGALGLAGSQLMRSRPTSQPENIHESEEVRTRLSTIEEETEINDEEEGETVVDNETVAEYHDEDEEAAVVNLNNEDDNNKQKSLLQVDTEDVDAVMHFLQQRMKSAQIIG